jgi:outer membrane receptor protein involved in Fe transport
VPITIQALSGAQLKDLSVSTIEDVLKYLPNVTFGTNGPGSGNIFMRGLSAGFAGNQSSATIAPFPNVATYIDDQSVTFPARNLDVYYADMERIEVLEGPQGTLFGGGAEAGVIRYITNKPKINVTEGDVQASYGTTAAGGDHNSSGIAVLNVPVIEDTLAVRGVIYDDHRGGYIDNVPSTFTRMNSDPGNYYFGKAVGGKCPNGLPPGPTSGGCVPANSQSANN